MVEIFPIPLRASSRHQLGRLHADLAAAYQLGTDLGPRAPHIQAGGDRLLEMTRVLERALGELDLSLIKLGLQHPDARDALQGFVIKAESLAATAQSFSNTAQGLAHMAQRYPAAL